jgi:hypothetical protein
MQLVEAGHFPALSGLIFRALAHFQGPGSFSRVLAARGHPSKYLTEPARSYLDAQFGLARQLANAPRRDGPFFGSGLSSRALAHFPALGSFSGPWLIPVLQLASTKNWPLSGYELVAPPIWPCRRLFGRATAFRAARRGTSEQRFDRTSAFLGA